MKKLLNVLSFTLVVLIVLVGGGCKEKIESPPSASGSVGGAANLNSAKLTVSFSDPATSAVVTSIATSGSANVNVAVQDALNNPISGMTVSFAVSNASAGTLAATTAVTNALGIATVQFNANAVNTIVTFTATATAAGGVSINNTATLTIGTPPPPVPQNLTITITPLSVNIQATATITVTATDSSGNAAYNTPITLNIISVGTTTLGSFSPTSAVTTLNLTTDTNGLVSATFYSGGSSGTATIVATATAGVPLPIVKSASLSITSVPNAVNMTISPSSLNSAGTALITAQVVNLLGQPVPDGTQVNVTCFAGACGIGTFPAVATTVSGTASLTFTASASSTGSAIIQASAGTAPNVVSGTAQITVNAAVTSSIEFSSTVSPIIGIQGSGTTDNTAVIFLVKDSNGTPKANVLVDFLLFGPTGSYLGNTVGSTTATGSTGADGTVSVILHAGMVAGPARIVATVDGTTISTSSGNISIGGGVPSYAHLDLSTSQFNLEGFYANGIQATIGVYVADRFGNYNVLQGTSVSFFTEAGAIDTSGITNASGLSSAVLRTQAPLPEDVAPFLGEPFYTEVDLSNGQTHTYNPRDGWVTVIAVTTGEESFVDLNGSGVYKLGDPFTDIGEPFIDANDNGVCDPGELFFNWPSYVPMTGPTGTYQTGNGVWDAQIPIWKSIKLVFTGQPSTGITATSPQYPYGKLTSRIECPDPTISPLLYGAISIPAGGQETFNVYVSDDNMNTLIGGTIINATLFTGSGGALVSPTPLTLADAFSSGPTTFQVVLQNTNTTASDESGDFYVEVTWKNINYYIYYPNPIILLHP